MCAAVLLTSVVLTGCTGIKQSDNGKGEQALLIMADGTLYYWTEETDCFGSAEDIDGYIESSVDEDKIPRKDGDSNFGCIGNQYAYGNDNHDTLLVWMGDGYHIFEKQK